MDVTRVILILNCSRNFSRVNYFRKKSFSMVRPKKLCMFAVVRPSLNIFYHENLPNILEDLFENFYVSLGTTASCIWLLKRDRFATSASFNVIEMA